MNYELALELKNAGFPQDIGGPGQVLWADPVYGPSYYAPTLSELIEACGNRFGSLFAVWSEDSFKFGKTPVIEGWVAHEVMKGGADQASKTPEEAVARLWLALNKKTP